MDEHAKPADAAESGALSKRIGERSPELRELTVLVNLAEELEERLRIENPDGVNADQLDAEFWHVRIARMAVIEVLATGRMSISSLETLALMPPIRRQMMLSALAKARQVTDDGQAIELIDRVAFSQITFPK